MGPQNQKIRKQSDTKPTALLLSEKSGRLGPKHTHTGEQVPRPLRCDIRLHALSSRSTGVSQRGPITSQRAAALKECKESFRSCSRRDETIAESKAASQSKPSRQRVPLHGKLFCSRLRIRVSLRCTSRCRRVAPRAERACVRRCLLKARTDSSARLEGVTRADVLPPERCRNRTEPFGARTQAAGEWAELGPSPR